LNAWFGQKQAVLELEVCFSAVKIEQEAVASNIVLLKIEWACQSGTVARVHNPILALPIYPLTPRAHSHSLVRKSFAMISEAMHRPSD